MSLDNKKIVMKNMHEVSSYSKSRKGPQAYTLETKLLDSPLHSLRKQQPQVDTLLGKGRNV